MEGIENIDSIAFMYNAQVRLASGYPSTDPPLTKTDLVDITGTKYIEEILVAGREVHPPLGSEFGLHRLDGQAIGGDGAVAATLADQLIDDDALGRIGEQAALAAPALFGRAGLIVDQHCEPTLVHQLALNFSKFAAVVD